MSKLGIVPVCAVLCACHAVDFAPVEQTVVVETPAVWRGTEATLQSSGFVGPDTLPIVRLNGAVATARHLDSTRVAVLMPDSAASFGVTVEFHDGWVGLADSITTGGALVRVRQGVPLWGPMAWPNPHGGRIVTNFSGPPTRVGFVDLANPSVFIPLPIPDSLAQPTCLYVGPGPSVTGGFVVAGGSSAIVNTCAMMRVWSYAPNGALVATDSMYKMGTFSAFVGNGAWVVWSNHAYHHWSYAQDVFLQAVEGDRALISPRGDRVAPVNGWVSAGLGVPVFRTDTAAVAFHVPGAAVTGADFSAGGDTLFMGVGSIHGAGPSRIVAVDASSGLVLAGSDSLPATEDNMLVAEPSAPWLYFAGVSVMHVIDRRTMKVVARLPYERIPPPPHTGTWYYTFLDAGARRLYVYEANNGMVYEFSVLP